MASSLSNWEDLPTSGVHLNFGPVTLVAYRTGSVTDAGRGIFFGNDEVGVQPYSDLHENAPINQYTITAENAAVAPSVMALYPALFKGKTFSDAVWEEDKKSGFKSSVWAARRVEARVAKKVRSLGHDAIVYTKPPAPATYEVAVIDQKRAVIEKTASCFHNMSKTAYISPSTGELEIDVIRDATPRVVINLDLGIPNFTVFSLKFPLVSEEPKNMAVVTQEALGVLLDEVATFMLSLKFEQAVITDVYARSLSCFAGMTMESSTQADYSLAGKDPTMDTYKGTFQLPQSFVQETQKRVVTGASFVKRVPKQRVVEFVKAVPVNKNTINDAQRTIQMYKNRQLKTQPKPLYVLVYDTLGNPTGVLPVQQQWKNKLLRKIQSWDKTADNKPAGPVVVDQEYNGTGVDTAGTQKFTGVRPQVPPTNPGVAGTSTASSASGVPEKLIAEIRRFVALHAKEDVNEPGMLSSPDAYQMLEAAESLQTKGFITHIPFSEWSSGGYKPYLDKKAKAWHDALLVKLQPFVKKTASKKQASAPEKNGTIGKEVYDAMVKRCFNLDSETDGSAEYERHEGDIRIKVHFDGQEIGDVEATLSGGDRGRWSSDNVKKHGWEGIQSFTNTYGD
jgi:hypothetical protein